MKVIITGATGMVGKGVLLECLHYPEITEVLSISRKTTAIDHPKLRELIHADFSELASVSDRLELTFREQSRRPIRRFTLPGSAIRRCCSKSRENASCSTRCSARRLRLCRFLPNASPTANP